MNSNRKLQEEDDHASSLGDVSPALATGGLSDGPALSIATDVMQAIINGGPAAQPYNWKWNRFNVTPFCTLSYQQDYFIPGLINLGWLENAWASNINQTSIPKQKQQVEVHKDLEVTYDQTGYPGKLCWMPNSTLQTGTWGAVPLGPTPDNPSGDNSGIGPNASGQQNPGPGVVYINPLGAVNQPINATSCITDPNGNLWVLTIFGVCGNVQPAWPASPVFPTIISPTTVATSVSDGTCVWTAINQAVGQMRAPRFRSLGQTLEPIPDDFEWAFKQGFFAECFRRNPDPKVRSKYTLERSLWLDALDKAVRQADREMDDVGFYPGNSIMDMGWAGYRPRPDYPWNG